MSFKNILEEGNWSLFLDRDGVINRMVEGGYVLEPSELEILPGVREAIVILDDLFSHIFIATNQQCISKGLITSEGIDHIHDIMLREIDPGKRYITDIFVSPFLAEENNPFRKPGTGMADEAAARYPLVDLKRSVMAGDFESDMLFGRRSGMITVHIGDGIVGDDNLVDYYFGSLLDFANSLIDRIHK